MNERGDRNKDMGSLGRGLGRQENWLTVTTECPSQNTKSNAVTSSWEAIPSKCALNHSPASSAGAAAGPTGIGQRYWAHPLLLCREVWLGKPKRGWSWAGVERHQHTGARQPDILSLVLPLKSLSSLETGFLVGEGVVFNLSSYNGLHGNKNKLSWEKSDLFFPLWGISRSFPLFCAGAAAQPRRAQVVSMTGAGRKQGAMTCSLHLPCIPSRLLLLACPPHCMSLL